MEVLSATGQFLYMFLVAVYYIIPGSRVSHSVSFSVHGHCPPLSARLGTDPWHHLCPVFPLPRLQCLDSMMPAALPSLSGISYLVSLAFFLVQTILYLPWTAAVS